MAADGLVWTVSTLKEDGMKAKTSSLIGGG
jgi:hypothetical protein